MTTKIEAPIELLLTPEELRVGLETDTRVGLTATPKWLPPKYFCDQRGSQLFEEITRLPEYYPTRPGRARADRCGAAGLRLEHWWADPASDFTLLLARR